jgi:hypothetical protein
MTLEYVENKYFDLEDGENKYLTSIQDRKYHKNEN